ncbi:MAG TPA: hypothetical protein VGQ57_02190, partial [Polyangiaceae bacterium]|nr:hypothetical protein [Polyangiaceae bacterium]
MDPAPAVHPITEAITAGLTLFPAALAALFGAANWSLAQLPGTRRAALRDSLEGAPRLALDRYIEFRDVIEARWLVVRAIGVALTAVLLGEVLPSWFGPELRPDLIVPPIAALGAVAAYAVPTEILKAVATQ